MNTLEVDSIGVVWCLVLCVRFVRNWMRGMRPRTLMDWVQAITYGFGFSLGIVFVLDLVTHPDRIQPAPAWQSWWIGFWFAVAILGLLESLAVTLGRRIRQLGR